MKVVLKIVRRPIALLAIMVLVLASCKNREWPKDDQNQLIKRCTSEGGTKAYCKCYLKNAMEKFNDPSDIEEIDFETAVALSIDCKE